jgi:hypothetical protein
MDRGELINGLGDTPSRKDGIDAATENKYRVWGCQLINEAGIMLVLYRGPLQLLIILLSYDND